MSKTKEEKKKSIVVKEGGNAVVRIFIQKRVKNGAHYTSFLVADYSSGKRKLIAFADEADARAKAKDIAIKMANQEGAVLKLTSEDRLVYVRALEYAKPTGLALDFIAQQYAEILKRLGGRSPMEAIDYFIKKHPVTLPKRTVREVFDEMITAKKQEGLSKRHVGDLDARLTRFADDFKIQIADVTAALVRKWIQDMDIANRTRNNFRLAIQTLCSFAKSREYLPRDWNEMENVPVWKTAEAEVEIFSPEELATLLSVAPDNMVPYLAIGAFAGLRSAEIERLDWSKVDLKNGYITVGADIAKTNSRRLVPLTDNLKAWLKPYAKKAGPVMELANVPNAIQRLVDATRPESDDPENPKKVMDPAVKWRHNALRHSFCSYRLASVKSSAQVSLEAGNSPSMIFKFYRELVTEEQAKIWFSILPGVDQKVITLPAESRTVEPTGRSHADRKSSRPALQATNRSGA